MRTGVFLLIFISGLLQGEPSICRVMAEIFPDYRGDCQMCQMKDTSGGEDSLSDTLAVSGKKRPHVNRSLVYYPKHISYLSGWEKDSSGRSVTTIRTAAATQAILSWNTDAVVCLNGDPVEAAQVSLTRDLYSRLVGLRPGINKLEVQTGTDEAFRAFICRSDGFPFDSVPGPAHLLTGKELLIPYKRSSIIKTKNNVKVPAGAFQEGIGCGANLSCGRFGFTFESGLLDYSQPAFGIIARQYLMGHPGNKRLAVWRLSCRPPQTECQLFRTRPDQTDLSPGAEINANWISYQTRAVLRSTGNFHKRQKGAHVSFSTTISIASPGFLVETDDHALVLSDFSAAGGFLYAGLPLKDGFLVKNTAKGGLVYEREKDGELSDNWILLWGDSRTGIKESPLLVVLQHQPVSIEFDRTKGMIEIYREGEFGYAVLAAPFGIEWQLSDDTAGPEWIKSVLPRCSFWSKALLAYPVGMEEDFRINEEKEHVEIVQQFQYRYLAGDWDTEPLEVAPFPPPVMLAAAKISKVDVNYAVDLNFPTMYGDLYGVTGTNTAVYRIPLPPLARKFPLKATGDTVIAELFARDFAGYLNYHDSQPESTPSPGAYAPLAHYTYPLTLFNFIGDNKRREIVRRLNQVLPLVTDSTSRYTFDNSEGGTSLFDTGKKITGSCSYWYERTEPHTRVNYFSTYLHVSNVTRFGKLTRENIERCEFPMTEIDWGNGFSLYQIYLAALLTGNWDPVRKNWAILKQAFRYFEVMQDWACMAAPFYEDGKIWNDGACLGAYLGFSQMARLIEDKNSYDRARYAAAKYLVMTEALFLAGSDYFPSYLGGRPWFTHKFFYEETGGAARYFLCHPLLEDQIRRPPLYNFTTEGLYPELIGILNRYLPGDLKKLTGIIYGSEPGCLDRTAPELLSWYGPEKLGQQEVHTLLMMDILTHRSSKEETVSRINQAYDNNRLFHEWITATPKYRRRVPENWGRCSLLTMLAARDYPVWIENWIGVDIKAAEYDESRKTSVIVLGKGPGVLNLGLQTGIRPKSVRFENRTVPAVLGTRNISLIIPSAGKLEITF